MSFSSLRITEIPYVEDLTLAGPPAKKSKSKESAPFKCPIISCSKPLDSQLSIVRRYNHNHAGEPLRCPYGGCGRSSQDPAELQKHAVAEHEMITCSRAAAGCLASFQTETKMLTHESACMKHGRESSQSAQFRLDESYQGTVIHIKVIVSTLKGRTRYHCLKPDCTNTLSAINQIKRHMKAVHGLPVERTKEAIL